MRANWGPVRVSQHDSLAGKPHTMKPRADRPGSSIKHFIGQFGSFGLTIEPIEHVHEGSPVRPCDRMVTKHPDQVSERRTQPAQRTRHVKRRAQRSIVLHLFSTTLDILAQAVPRIAARDKQSAHQHRQHCGCHHDDSLIHVSHP